MQVFSNIFELLVNVFEAFVLVHFIFSFHRYDYKSKRSKAIYSAQGQQVPYCQCRNKHGDFGIFHIVFRGKSIFQFINNHVASYGFDFDYSGNNTTKEGHT